jgi:hypothetical protein
LFGIEVLAPREKLPPRVDFLTRTTFAAAQNLESGSNIDLCKHFTGSYWQRYCPVFKMPSSLDKCKERPPHIETILNGLDRYNPETTTVFQDYVTQQCEEKFFDSYACLALLKL